MLHIAVCDAMKQDLEDVVNMTKNLLQSLNIQFILDAFDEGTSLLASTISYDLIILSIEMNEIDGIEIARKIRIFNCEGKIIFTTNSMSYLRIGYTVSANGYFIKPLNQIQFNQELSNILKNNLLDNKFILDTRISPNKVLLKNILYIEFYNRRTIVHKLTEIISTPLALKEWRHLLNDYGFSQNHKAYIVNLKFIKKYKSGKILLSNDEILPLSRKYKPDFKKEYLKSIDMEI